MRSQMLAVTELLHGANLTQWPCLHYQSSARHDISAYRRCKTKIQSTSPEPLRLLHPRAEHPGIVVVPC